MLSPNKRESADIMEYSRVRVGAVALDVPPVAALVALVRPVTRLTVPGPVALFSTVVAPASAGGRTAGVFVMAAGGSAPLQSI